MVEEVGTYRHTDRLLTGPGIQRSVKYDTSDAASEAADWLHLVRVGVGVGVGVGSGSGNYSLELGLYGVRVGVRLEHRSDWK